MLQQPHRSQSFRHRPRPNALLLGARGAANNNSQQLQNPQQQQQLGGEVDSTPERRRSTPTIHRRASLSRGAARVEPRIDVWPRAKPMSEAEERFLQLPDFADYTRVRQFNIDAKGAVIHRGDSFRRKRRPSPVPASTSVQQQQQQQQQPHSNGHSAATASESFEHQQQQQQIQQQEQQEDEEDQQNRTNSARTSVSSLPPTAHPQQQQQGKQSSPAATSSIALRESALQNGSTHSNTQSQHSSSAPISDEGTSSQQISSYRICVLGQAGAGKSSLVAQFVSSSAFGADLDMELPSCNGSISNNGGQQSTAASPNGIGGGGGGGDSCVSVNIGGHECELLFQEWDLPEQQEQLHQLSSQLARRCGSGQFHALALVYSIDRRASFRVALRTLELLRSGGCPSPLLLVGNKADLERKRAVGEAEVKAAMLTYDVPHFEVSVALNHDVDDLLVGIVAQVKESFRMNVSDQKSHSNNNSTRSAAGARGSTKEDSTEDFHAAIRRFSQRKKRQMGVAEVDGMQTGKCMNLFEKLRKWRKGTSNC